MYSPCTKGSVSIHYTLRYSNCMQSMYLASVIVYCDFRWCIILFFKVLVKSLYSPCTKGSVSKHCSLHYSMGIYFLCLVARLLWRIVTLYFILLLATARAHVFRNSTHVDHAPITAQRSTFSLWHEGRMARRVAAAQCKNCKIKKKKEKIHNSNLCLLCTMTMELIVARFFEVVLSSRYFCCVSSK